MTEEEYKQTIVQLAQSIINLTERVDRALEQHAAIMVNVEDLEHRLAEVEKRRQTSVLIPMIIGAYAISIATLAVVITVLYNLLMHMLTDVH